MKIRTVLFLQRLCRLCVSMATDSKLCSLILQSRSPLSVLYFFLTYQMFVCTKQGTNRGKY